MRYTVLIASLLAILLSLQEAEASIVGGNAAERTLSDPGPPGPPDGQVNGDTSDFVATQPAMAGGVGTVTGTVIFYAKASPLAPAGRSFDANFGQLDSDAATTYEFTLTIENFVGSAPANPDQDAALGDEIGPIDIEIVDFGGSGIPVFDETAPAHGTSSSTFANGNFFTNSAGNRVLRIGGLNGGGFAIPWGETTATIVFSLIAPDLTNAFQSFDLRFTANPEPGTMALAGIAVSCLGLGYRRRRQKPEIVP